MTLPLLVNHIAQTGVYGIYVIGTFISGKLGASLKESKAHVTEYAKKHTSI